MAHESLIIGAVIDSDDVQRHPLGAIYVEPANFGSERDPAAGVQIVDRGRRVYIYVGAAGVAITRRLAASRQAGGGAVGTRTYGACVQTPVASNPYRVVGVRFGTDLALSQFGWLVREGLVEIENDDHPHTADNILRPPAATAGRFLDSAVFTNSGLGVALQSSAAVPGETLVGWVNCPG